jgi:hypothetical protein
LSESDERVGVSRGSVVRPVALVALVGGLLSPGLWIGPGFDASVYTLAGVTIRDGRMPYVDVFDNKPPGLYVVDALGQIVLPWLDPWLVSWLLTFAFSSVATLIVYRLLLKSYAPATAFVGGVACAIGTTSHAVALGGGLTESFAVLPLVIGLWLATQRPGGPRTALLVGVLGGLSCLFSVQASPAAALLVVAVATDRAGPIELIRRLAGSAVGACGVLAVVGSWLAIRGALGDAIDEVIVYNFSYRNASPGLGATLVAATLLLAGWALLVAVSAFAMIRRPHGYGRLPWISLIWVVSMTAWILYQNRLYLHYLILVTPPLVIACLPGLGWLKSAVIAAELKTRVPAQAVAVAAGALCSVSGVWLVALCSLTITTAAAAGSVTAQTAAWIDANTPAGATVFVWGNDTDIYLVSGRIHYDRHIYQYPMVTEGYWSPARTAALLATWTLSPPSVIVETPATVPMFQPAPDPPMLPNYDTFGPLRGFVRSHYRLAATYGTGDTYEGIYVYVAGG